MSTILFSAGTTQIFNPSEDMLLFDNDFYAKDVIVSSSGDATIFTTSTGSMVLSGLSLQAITHSNVSFANGSELLVGDDTTNTTADNNDNSIVGTANNDQIYGMGGSDIIDGDSGNDIIYGGANVSDSADAADHINGGQGADIIYANGGNDTVTGSSGASNDVVYTGVGNDTVNYSASSDPVILYGNAGSDTLTGSTGDDVVYGGNSSSDASDAADSINGGAGADIIYANGGADSVRGTAGNDTIYGGGGNDIITYSGGSDAVLIYGNGDSDNLTGSAGNDIILGGSGASDTTDSADTIDGGSGNDVIYGNSGNDNIVGTVGADTIYGGADNDTINYSSDSSAALLYGNDGGDTLTGGTGNDTIYGGSSANDSSDAADSIIAGAGSDLVYGNYGSDTITGSGAGTAASTLYGGAGDDTINWSAVAGNYGAAIYGNEGNDSITGSGGIDTIIGGNGADSITLGSGTQNIVLYTENHAAGATTEDLAAGSSSIDRISSFATGTGSSSDIIRFSGSNLMASLIASGGTAGVGGTIAAMHDASTFTNGAVGAIEYYDDGTNIYFRISTAANTAYTTGGDITITLSGLSTGSAGGTISATLSASGDITISSITSINTMNGGSGTDNFTGTSGTDLFSGEGGNDNFTFSIANLGSHDSIYGGNATADSGTSDTLIFSDSGDINLSTLGATISGVDVITLYNNGGFDDPQFANTLILTNAIVASANYGGVAGVLRINAGDCGDSIDGSAVTTGAMSIVGGGNDTLIGGSGNDTIKASSSDTTIIGGGGADSLVGGMHNTSFYTSIADFADIVSIVGGLGGTGADSLIFTDAGDIDFTAHNNIDANDGVDKVILDAHSSGHYTITLSSAVVSGADTRLTVDDSASTIGDTIDGSLGTESIYIISATGGNGGSSITGGSGDDTISINASDFIANHTGGDADTMIGGAGTNDVLIFTDAATVTSAAFAHVTGIEAITLANVTGNNIQINDAMASATTTFMGFQSALTITGGGGNDTIDGSSVTTQILSIYSGGGADQLIGGAANDYFSVDAANFNSNDNTITGGTGTDRLTFTGTGAIASAAFTHVTGIERIDLNSNSVAINATVASSATGGAALTINGNDADTIDASAATVGVDITGGSIMTGGSGADTIYGGYGNDIIIGGGNSSTTGDSLIGSSYIDTFVFNNTSNAIGSFAGTDSNLNKIDTIVNFTSGTDDIQLATTANAFGTGLTFSQTTTAAVTALSVDASAVTTVTQLASAIANAAAGGGTASTNNTAVVYDVTTTGTGNFASQHFLVVNNATAAIGIDDAYILLSGSSLSIAAGDFTFAS